MVVVEVQEGHVLSMDYDRDLLSIHHSLLSYRHTMLVSVPSDDHNLDNSDERIPTFLQRRPYVQIGNLHIY